jgi:UPF0755 protein
MLKKLKIISIFILVILAVFILFFISYWRGISAPLDEKGRDKVFVVSRGESVKDIAANLYDSGLINSKTYFEIYIWRTKKEKDLQAGEYILNPKMNIKEVAEIISGGRQFKNFRFAITFLLVDALRLDNLWAHLADPRRDLGR